MDDNISHAIALMGATLLFMVAFSLSVIFYDGLKDRADEFFEATSLAGKQESATGIIMNRDDLERKIRFEEIFLSILNLPAYVSGDGNADASKVIIKQGNTVKGVYTASFDIDNNLKMVELSGHGATTKLYPLSGTYDPSDPKYSGKTFSDNINMLKDLATITIGVNPPGTNSNDALKDATVKNAIKNTTFSIQYSGDAIVYVRN